MKFLHTSDWHLGRTLHGTDLLDHQAAFLDHLVDLARAERVDAVLVAGDVYDRAVPPVEAVTLLSQTLSRLAEICSVVVTPGNHDSATRLGFTSSLLRDGVHLRTRVAELAVPVVVPGEVTTLVYALPYLDPDATRRVLSGVPEDPAASLPRSHEAVVAAATGRVMADVATRRAAGSSPVRVVVVAHAFVIGGEVSGSERDIRVGGVDNVPAGVFAGADYVALGHLHGPQRVPGPHGTMLRYSGSPLAYSFSEVNHVKSTAMVTLADDGLHVELVPAPVPRRMAELTGPLEAVLGPQGDGHDDDWLRITVTDPVRPSDLHARLRSRFPHALVIQHLPEGAARERSSGAVTADQDPLEVAAQFVTAVTGIAPSEAEARVVRRALETVRAAQASA